jgi:S-disulfanyl-L-cysteine oxidoreductase SoxD
MIATGKNSAALFLLPLLALWGCKARQPGKWETSLMTSMEHHVFVGNKKAQNPLPATPENIAAGRETFSYYCVVCHGLDGQNTGVPFAEKMFPPVPSLASPNVQSYTDGQLEWIIANGLGPSGMPASRGILSDEEIWDVVVYIRHLPPAGSLGEPPVYNGNTCSPAPGESAGHPSAGSRH